MLNLKGKQIKEIFSKRNQMMEYLVLYQKDYYYFFSTSKFGWNYYYKVIKAISQELLGLTNYWG